MIRWAGFLAVAAAVVAYAVWTYRSRELPVRGRAALAALRGLALVALALLLFDPVLPVGGAGGSGARWALLDVSLSMSAAAGDAARTAWDDARARAAELSEGGWRILTFGDGVRPLEDALERPSEPHSLLASALERAAEAGAREVRVISDGRFEDGVAVRRAVDALPLLVAFEIFGGELRNAGIARFEVADVPRPDDPATAEVEVHATGGVGPVSVTILEEGRVVASIEVEAPPDGLRRSVAVPLPGPLARGRVRFEARVSAAGDGFPDDDRAVSYASVGHEEGALVMVSLRPDWEPRFLLPVLSEVTGLPTTGYLRTGPDRFAPMGRAVERGQPTDSAAVAAAAADAALLVVHGLGRDADGWARRLAARRGRTMVWLHDAEGARILGLEATPPVVGEWYASSDIPASALAGSLAGVELLGLPPLTAVVPVAARPETSVPLRLQLRGSGPSQAALALEDGPGGRRAVVLSRDFWRWAARAGTSRAAYRALWSGVAGWLIQDRRSLGPVVRPTRWVYERGEAVGWRVPGEAGDSVLLTLTRGDSTVLERRVAAGTSSTGPHAPGTYGYRAADDDGRSLGEGRFDVETRTLELAHPTDVPEPTERDAAVAGVAGAGRPVRTSPWPYLLVIVLLCAEWIGRRRLGLR